ncbi:MAG: tRNA dihydrouridine synthase DusB [Ignavibacteriales bacterium]
MEFKIGNLTFKNQVISAPMAGITDKAYRTIAASFGCGLTFTEMISDQALIHGHHRTKSMLDTGDEQVPAVVQIFGSQPQYMREAAVFVREYGARIIDINMGCPTPKIVKNGEGSALMKDLVRAREVIRAVVSAVDVPVTVKMRKGWDEDGINYLELAHIAEGEGVQAITIHPRTREQFFSGHSDWTAIARIKEAVNIPVIGNGDIFCAEDALAMMSETGCDAVMIGRGALGNPFILREVAAALAGETIPPGPTMEERIRTALHHLDLVAELKGYDRAIPEMRKHFAWYTKGLKGAARARDLINQATTREQIIEILQS